MNNIEVESLKMFCSNCDKEGVGFDGRNMLCKYFDEEENNWGYFCNEECANDFINLN